MTRNKKGKNKTEFGDFQTPLALAMEACKLLLRLGIQPKSIVEPTCGLGSFFEAGLDQFKGIEKAAAADINDGYLKNLREKNNSGCWKSSVEISCGDFFKMDWGAVFAGLPEPILTIGNPPWVTNSELGAIGSLNLPAKSNFQQLPGLEAITGKGNFDISEWMLNHLLGKMNGKSGALAMLCKTAVARKVLMNAWRKGYFLTNSKMFLIDAKRRFKAAVDACFFVCQMSPGGSSSDCDVYEGFSEELPQHTIGFRDNRLAANVCSYSRLSALMSCRDPLVEWRSGVKHDCSKVMELAKANSCYENGLGEEVDIESSFLYPMLKSSEIANGKVHCPFRYMLVTQKNTGEKTRPIETRAPKTWAYLVKHGSLLDNRGSSVYKKRPRFSIFGVGGYSFSPWKVAISGFYKKLEFKVIGKFEDKPIVLDDASCFIPCEDKTGAEFLASLLNSPLAKEFFEAFVFWDAKRPITMELLRSLDLRKLADRLGREKELESLVLQKKGRAEPGSSSAAQQELFALSKSN